MTERVLCADEKKHALLNNLTDLIVEKTVCGSCRIEMLMEVLSTEMLANYPMDSTDDMTAVFRSYVEKNRPIVMEELKRKMN